FLRAHVRGLAHIDHRSRKPEYVRRLDAELTRRLSNRRSLRMRRPKLTRPTAETPLKRRHLRGRAVHSLLHTSPRRLPIHRGLRRQAQTAQRRSTKASQGCASGVPRLTILLRGLHHPAHSRIGTLRGVLRALANLLGSLRRLRHGLVKALHLGAQPDNNGPVSQRAPPIPARRPNYSLEMLASRARACDNQPNKHPPST